jgi:hypothetical protein
LTITGALKRVRLLSMNDEPMHKTRMLKLKAAHCVEGLVSER